MSISRISNRNIVAYANHHMITQMVTPKLGSTAWAYYPKDFFGIWRPQNRNARRSMKRPKRVTYLPIIGWTFDIEIQMMATRSDRAPVGLVYSAPESGLPASNIRGTVGYLATTPTKRVKVICAF